MKNYRHANWRPTTLPNTSQLAEILRRVITRSGDVYWADWTTTTAGTHIHYVRGIYHFTFGERVDDLDFAVRHVMRRLNMHRWYTAKHLHRGIYELMRAFYAEQTDCLAIVIYENCREPFSQRCKDFQNQGTNIQQKPLDEPAIDDQYGIAYSSYDTRTLRILDRLPLNLRYLPFQLPPDTPKHGAAFRGTGFKRTLTTQPGYERSLGIWDIWGLARPGDDDKALRNGRYTAKPPELLDGELNQSKIMTWMQVELGGFRKFSICLDFDSQTEQLLSIRSVEMSLEDFVMMDPRLGKWLHEASRQYPLL